MSTTSQHLHHHRSRQRPPSPRHPRPRLFLETAGCLTTPASRRVPEYVLAEARRGVPELHATGGKATLTEESGLGSTAMQTIWQVSRQSRESRASSSQVSSSSLPPFSRACSAIRKKHQPSRYHASTSWSSEAMIPCRTRSAAVYRDSSRKSFTIDRRAGMGGSCGSSTCFALWQGKTV